MVHGEEEYQKAVNASSILFGNSTSDQLRELDERTFLSVFDGVPQFELPSDKLPGNIIDILAVETSVFPSKGECRKMIQGGGVSINKDKCDSIDRNLTTEDLINGKYILAQRGKKNYYIIKVV
jgi:tyrosyl-tRNA synthetase